MKIITSRYNHDIRWIREYTLDVVMYDRSEVPIEGSIVVPNIGSDIFDKLTFIIDNYEQLPEVAVYCKANLFKYISKEEFDIVCNNRTFTPLLTKHHTTYMPVCRYAENGLYEEINNRWFLHDVPTRYVKEYDELIGHKFKGQKYKPFAPGSNYIIPRANLLKYPKSFYETLRSYLAYERYPGEAFLLERDLYNIFNND